MRNPWEHCPRMVLATRDPDKVGLQYGYRTWMETKKQTFFLVNIYYNMKPSSAGN